METETMYYFKHRIKGEEIVLISKKEGDSLAIFYANDIHMHRGDPWQFISDLDKARLYGVHEGIAACKKRFQQSEMFTEVGLDMGVWEIEPEDNPIEIDY